MAQIVKALFIFLLCMFPLGQVARVELGGGLNILFNDVVVFILAISWVLKKAIRKEKIIKTPITRAIVLFSGVALFSLVINSMRFPQYEIFVSSLYLVRWVSYACLYFIVMEFSDLFKKRILLGLVVVGGIISFLGLLQYILYPDLRNLFYAGWDEHLYRLFSSLLDPNFAGAIFILTFFLATGREQLIFLSAIISFIALLLTYSRGSFLSFLGGLLIFLFLTKKRKLVIAIIGLFILGLALLPKNLRSEGVRLFRTASIEQRRQSMEHAVVIFKDSPLFGVGFNTYRYTQQKYGFITEKEAKESHAAAGTDNSFLFVLATTGIIGFLIYSFLWLTIVKEVWRSPLIIATIVAIFVHALFVNSLFYPHIMEWLWILIAATKVRR